MRINVNVEINVVEINVVESSVVNVVPDLLHCSVRPWQSQPKMAGLEPGSELIIDASDASDASSNELMTEVAPS